MDHFDTILEFQAMHKQCRKQKFLKIRQFPIIIYFFYTNLIVSAFHLDCLIKYAKKAMIKLKSDLIRQLAIPRHFLLIKKSTVSANKSKSI